MTTQLDDLKAQFTALTAPDGDLDRLRARFARAAQVYAGTLPLHEVLAVVREAHEAHAAAPDDEQVLGHHVARLRAKFAEAHDYLTANTAVSQ
jgi:hypothetical protein